ncbi:MAG TPA: hypothetical protein VGK97_09885 [Spongiibacteraceae bacterium]|jgi:hypothetical protein
MKKLMQTLLFLILIVFCVYGYFFYQNNRDTSALNTEQIAQSYERGVTWLLSHRDEILRDGNPMLWWMLGESARISGDERVAALYDEFRQNYDRYAADSIWQVFFSPAKYRGASFPAEAYQPLVEYQQYFLYTLTCSSQLEREPLIQAQNDPQFCWHGTRMIRPACATHQLMGYRMAQRNNCTIENLDKKIGVLQKTIERQLRYDPRVVDVYVQRVLMLVESDAQQRLKPRWLQRVLQAQLEDGGWSSMQPIALVGGKQLVFDSKAVTIATPRSDFHATAQGVLLMSLLRSKDIQH